MPFKEEEEEEEEEEDGHPQTNYDSASRGLYIGRAEGDYPGPAMFATTFGREKPGKTDQHPNVPDNT